MVKRRGNRRSSAATKWFGGIGCLTLVVALAIGGVFLYQRIKQGFGGSDGTTDPTMATEDVVVQRGDVTEAASLWGQVQPIRTQSLAFHAAGGRIISVDAVAGMPVTAGQVLVSLDVAALERDLTEAQAELEEAQAKLDELTKVDPIRQYELEVELSDARANLAEARQALADYDAGRGTRQEKRQAAAEALAETRAAFNELVNGEAWAEELAQLQYVYNVAEVEHGVYTQIQNPSEQDRDREWLLRIDMEDKAQALESAKLTHTSKVRAAQQEVVEAQRVLEALDREIALGSAATERARLAVAVQLAEAQVTTTEASLAALGQDVDEVKLVAAQAEVLKLEGNVADAEAALADAQLVAPFDGTVLDVQAVADTMASTGATLVTLADTSAYVVAASVSELDIARVQAGMEATLTFDAFGTESPVTGYLGDIPAYGRYSNGVSEYPITIALDDVSLPLYDGMSATISIPLSVRQNVLVIPAAAVDYFWDGTYVNVVNGDQVESRRVVLGVGDGITVEVVDGLEEGEVVRMRLIGNQVYGYSLGG